MAHCSSTAGSRCSGGSDNALHLALWQYPQPTQAVGQYVVQLNDTLFGGFPALPEATYTYAFVQVISLPYKNGTVKQSTTPAGGEPPYPYRVVVRYLRGTGRAVFYNVFITGNFFGTTSDGYPFATQIYRMSSLDNAWNLLTTISNSGDYNFDNGYVDHKTDQQISGNQQTHPESGPAADRNLCS